MAEAEPDNVPKRRRQYMDTGKSTNPVLYSFANQALRKKASGAVHELERNERAMLGDRFFYLDHTAEVLENYRRIQENKIFDAALHESDQKKAFLKSESRKFENLLETSKYDSYNYFQDNATNEQSLRLKEHDESFMLGDFLDRDQK